MDAAQNELLAAAMDGDEHALGTLLEREGPAVRQALSLSRTLQSAVDLDDVMQVTYMEAFLRIRHFRASGPDSFRAWLRQIAENNLRDVVREQNRVKRPPPARRVGVADSASYVALLETLTCDPTTPSRTARANEIVTAVESALARLPADYERVIRLFELEGRTGPEVADLMGRSHAAIKMLLARARDHLREQLGSDLRFLSGSA
jgi:RNA polymerase sigma-70 factor (ECF subfamily)